MYPAMMETTTPSDNDELPTICVNDELYLSSPPPIALTLNNNIEKMDRQELMTKPPSIQSTTSNKNITNVNIITGWRPGHHGTTGKFERFYNLTPNRSRVVCVDPRPGQLLANFETYAGE
ncbi:hypothetical protein OS493_010853 [Desmophyllum pertusum]|uniref:Uncharacterized protein n=1 Tax=Desmophyllum pertusum TaxID=174260 RepID=A0A9X0CY09_9CNID|nr:hypothetical protein OS493_010853 [Desmophyllum pertusum]